MKNKIMKLVLVSGGLLAVILAAVGNSKWF